MNGPRAKTMRDRSQETRARSQELSLRLHQGGIHDSNTPFLLKLLAPGSWLLAPSQE